MAARERFEVEWGARFSGEEPPDLACFHQQADPKLLQKALDDCKSRIKTLEHELHKQNFVRSFLLEVINSKNGDNFTSENAVSKLQKSQIGETVTTGNCNVNSNLGSAENFKNYSDKNIDVDRVENSSESGSTKQKQNVKIDTSKYIIETNLDSPAPVTSVIKERQDSPVRSVSHKIATEPNPDRRGVGLNKAYSLPHRMPPSIDDKNKPVPAPRPSITGPARASIATIGPEIGESNTESDPEMPKSESPVPSVSLRKNNSRSGVIPPAKMPKPSKGSKFSHRQATYEDHVKKIDENPSDELSVVIHAPTAKTCSNQSGPYDNVGLSTFKPRTNSTKSNISSPEPPSEPAPPPPTFSHVIPVMSRTNSTTETIYDEPIPVKKNIGAESSDSDEEPMYFNLQLIKNKKQTLNKSVHSARIYSNVLDERKHLEEKALKLSKRYSLHDHENKSDPGAKAPLMKPVRHKRTPKAPAEEKSLKPPVEEVTVTVNEVPSPKEPSTPSSIPDRVIEEEGEKSSLASIGSASSLGSTDENAPLGWKKRQSMQMATGADTDSTEADELDMDVPLCGESEQLQMRKWVVNSIMESEKSYVDVLDVLQQYMKMFKNVAKSQNLVIPEEDVDTIFFKIPELYSVHHKFYQGLEPIVMSWTADANVAEYFKILGLEENSIAKEYLQNYQKALATVRRCSEQYPQFKDLTQEFSVYGMKEKLSLEELLHKPVVRFQRNTLVLHDLIRCTPTSHPDYDLLQKALKSAQYFLENFESPQSNAKPEDQRYLAKYKCIVELVGSKRKLRNIFLFNDVIVCAKENISGRQKITYELKWFIPLFDLALDEKMSAQEEKPGTSKLSFRPGRSASIKSNVSVLDHEEKQMDVKSKETDNLKKKVSEYQRDLKEEVGKLRSATDMNRHWSIRGHNKNVEKLRKKLIAAEAQLILSSPHLVFRLQSKKYKKAYMLLMDSDYERTTWKQTILALQTKDQVKGSVFTHDTLSNLVNSVKVPKVQLGSIFDRDDIGLEEEQLFGSLDVTIHGLHGLKQKYDTFCTLELDSFGHFFMKAKTNICYKASEPHWNENFELELEGSQTLRILVYHIGGDSDALIGKCALELSRAWLRGDFANKAITLNEEVSVTVSLRYASRAQTLKRTPSCIPTGVFGVRIRQLTEREGGKIPLIVSACVHEVERRGLHDVGIYRVSGLSSEIQRLKKAFEKNSKSAAHLATEFEINVVTGILKLYFRELPEALFTDALYNSFTTGMGLTDPEAKEKYMMSQMRTMPEPNLSTINYILNHLLMVSEHECDNKMSLHNLATVFGPTLLRPAMKLAEPVTLEMFSVSARDAMMQTGVLLYFLNCKRKGLDFGTQL